jgi:thiol-disulfide isomerase/thioredoxin
MNKPPRIHFITTVSFFLLLFASNEQDLHAQPSSVWPLKPKWGDTMHISYNDKAPAALLNGPAQRFVKLTVYNQEGGIKWVFFPLHTTQNLTTSYVIPPGTASLTLRFYTLNKDDEAAGKRVYIYEKDTLHPVAGAYYEDFFSPQPEKYFQKETGVYPQRYLAYGKYFNIVSMINEQERSTKIIDSLIPVLQKQDIQKKPIAAVWSSLCVGYAKTNRLTTAKAYLLKLMQVFPKAEETSFAFNLYNYEYYKLTGQMIEADLKDCLSRILRQFPEAPIVSSINAIGYLSNESQITAEQFEKALLPLYNEGHIPYHSLTQLPEIYLQRKQKTAKAKQLLEEAISQYESGSINHQYRLNVNHYYLYTAILYHQLAKTCLFLQEYHEAIQAVSTALLLISKSNAEGNFSQSMLQTRAFAFQNSGNLNMAMEDYKLLYQSGDTSAADSLKVLFPYCSNKEKTADELLASLQKNKAKKKNDTAPDFTGTDLQGNKVQLSSLKGKIVLLNFWGTGCGPCIVEMPELNKLVQKYKGSGEIIFLALTGDETAVLNQFFKNKKREFNYTVVNNTGMATENFQVQSLPIHIVIGRDGEILDRSVGARADIFEYLDRVITRNL